jgi:RNA polymerase sigma-70 factor (sigma-E family)
MRPDKVTAGVGIGGRVGEEEREEFRTFVVARSTALFRTAYLLTGSRPDAEDLLQTAFAKTFLAWSRIHDKQAADAYVRRVLLNAHTSRWRLRRVAETPYGELPEQASRDAVGAVDLHDALWRALETLPRRQRAVVVLRYYEDLSEPEVADLLGCAVGTVKSQSSRALAKLREVSGLRDDPRGCLPLALNPEV